MDRPLQNPKRSDFAPPQDIQTPRSTQGLIDLSSLPVVRTEKNKQLGLDLGGRMEKIQRAWGGLKSNIKRREQTLELIPYWRSIAPALALVSSILLVVGSGIAGIATFGQLQPKVPFQYNAFNGYWEQADKVVLLALPAALLVILMIILRFAYEVHRFDSRLSKTINYLLTFLNLMLIIALYQIYSLIFTIG